MDDTTPSWSELSNLLDQLAYIATAHAGVARTSLALADQPEGRDQLRQSLELLAKGQDEMATALRQAANLFGAMASGGQPKN